MFMYNIYQLENYAKKFLKETYNMDLAIPLQLNGRLKTTCGRFMYKRSKIDGSTQASRVELNKYFVENNEPSVVLDVLKHELVHYALFEKGKPNSDGHPVFERELKRLGIVSQSTINKYTIKSKPVNINIYECKDCKYEYKIRKALPNNGIYHKCKCGGSLDNKGKKLIEV